MKRVHTSGSFVRLLVVYMLLWIGIYISLATGIVLYFGRALPSLEQLERIQLKLSTLVYSSDGVILKQFAEEKRISLSYEEIPKAFIDAVLAIEDHRFYRHWGLDILRILKAAYVDLKARQIVEGASTVTQQLARKLFLSQEITLNRKIKEQLVALQIERTYAKREILRMYANQIYFGHGAYGVQSAARTFFNKNAGDLLLEECALLAAVLNSPGLYSPIWHPDRALRRRDLVLNRMADLRKITGPQAETAKAHDLGLHPRGEESGKAPYFVEYLRQGLEYNPKYGIEGLYERGLSIYTTVNYTLQQIAEESLVEQLQTLQKHMHNPPGDVQGALVALDTRTGQILAMVGGREFQESQFNRAVQALRQPGSAFKPFIYAAAIDNGYRTIDTVLDAPVSVPMYDGTLWQPENYDYKFLGPVTLREGLKQSRNVASIRLLMEIVPPKQAVQYAHMMGITTPLYPYYSLAIGTSEVTLLELTSAYSVFPNGGIRTEPISILRVLDRDGEVLEQHTQGSQEEVLNEDTAAIMVSLLQSVMEKGGTGYSARTVYGLDRPAGGKTGTTNEYMDAWYLGFTPQITAGVWIGFDTKLSLGSRMSGAVVALPVWARFMRAAHEVLRLPVEDFVIPESVVQLDLCAENCGENNVGDKIATSYCPQRIHELFKRGTEPTEVCTLHQPGIVGRSGNRPSDQPANPKRGSLEF